MPGIILLLCGQLLVGQVASSTTSTVSGGLPEAEPLTAEELKLVERLSDEADSPIQAKRQTGWWSSNQFDYPALVGDAETLELPVARTTIDLLRSFPLLARNHRTHDDAIVFLDGLRLEPARNTDRLQDGWLGLDPTHFERLTLKVPGRVFDAAESDRGVVSLYTGSPPPALRAQARLRARSADRSGGAYVDVGNTLGEFGLRVRASYDDFKDLRIATTSTEAYNLPQDARRTTIGVITQWRRPEDPAYARLAFNLDRLSDRPILSADQRLLGTEAFAERMLVSGTFGGRPAESLTYRAVAGYQRFRTRDRTEMYSVGGRGELHYQIDEALASQFGIAGSVGEQFPTGRNGRLEAFGSALYIGRFLDSRLDVRLSNVRNWVSESGTRVTSAESGVTVGATTRLKILDPYGIRASFFRSTKAASARDLIRRDARFQTLNPESAWTAELGPSFQFSSGWLEALAFFSLVDDALVRSESSAKRLRNYAHVHRYGAELQGQVTLKQVTLTAIGFWSQAIDQATRQKIGEKPRAEGSLSVLYRLGETDTEIELHARASAATGDTPGFGTSPELTLSFEPPESYFLVGGMARVGLSDPVQLILSVENVFDQSYLARFDGQPGAGVDLRAAVQYLFD